mmetsp:Transcript_18637/g.53748  ORF Transcript_18637/g.53748 Transcript_18637/m.53748 type:complete len:160 (+) Transcript_18637:391-870(+)
MWLFQYVRDSLILPYHLTSSNPTFKFKMRYASATISLTIELEPCMNWRKRELSVVRTFDTVLSLSHQQQMADQDLLTYRTFVFSPLFYCLLRTKRCVPAFNVPLVFSRVALWLCPSSHSDDTEVIILAAISAHLLHIPRAFRFRSAMRRHKRGDHIEWQ